ncbi:MAG: hypothetical protein ACREQ5_38160, partial [Candidatus Dormibacteria bacterium]
MLYGREVYFPDDDCTPRLALVVGAGGPAGDGGQRLRWQPPDPRRDRRGGETRVSPARLAPPLTVYSWT